MSLERPHKPPYGSSVGGPMGPYTYGPEELASLRRCGPLVPQMHVGPIGVCAFCGACIRPSEVSWRITRIEPLLDEACRRCGVLWEMAEGRLDPESASALPVFGEPYPSPPPDRPS